MKAGYTHISILLDRSGSMRSIMEEAKNSVIDFIREQLKIEGDLTVTFKAFSSSYIQEKFDNKFSSKESSDIVYTKETISNLEYYINSIIAIGGTPLYDNVCLLIDKTGYALAKLEEEKRPEKVIFIIITDGEENASVKYTSLDAKNRINHQIEKYNWQFVYLGANQDSFAEASKMGNFDTASVMNYSTEVGEFTKMSSSLTRSVSNYRSNATSSVNLTSE